MGTSEKTVKGIEEEHRKYTYRCIFAIKDIKAGDAITIENTEILHPDNQLQGIETIMYQNPLVK